MSCGENPIWYVLLRSKIWVFSSSFSFSYFRIWEYYPHQDKYPKISYFLLFLNRIASREQRGRCSLFFGERPMYVEVIWKEKIGVYLKYTKPYACGFTFEPSWDQRRTLKNLPPLSSKKTQLTTKIATEHRQHGPPIPPPSSGSNSKGECDLCTLRDRSWSAQHDDIIFLHATNFLKIYWLFFYRQRRSAPANKRWVS